jgi:hypothetical protein
MFGYIRPLKGELKVREFELFRSVYCGLCHTLKKRYGFFARFALNYDFTFLTMLLAEEETQPRCVYRKCSASPFRKKACIASGISSEQAADYSVILAYYKLRDTLKDESLFKKLYIGPACWFFKGKFKKACARRKEFALEVRDRLNHLSKLEESGSSSIDKTADQFALILEAAACEIQNPIEKIAAGKLLYHIGRMIYLLDAFDDAEEDRKADRYNPLLARFGDFSHDESAVSAIQTTLVHSAGIAAADFELLPKTVYTDILSNIIYLGIPNAIDLVLKGQWKAATRKQSKNYTNE